MIENNGKEYRLVHAGLSNFAPDKAMNEYDLYDFLEERTDYTKVYMKNGHAALDCACVAVTIGSERR